MRPRLNTLSAMILGLSLSLVSHEAFAQTQCSRVFADGPNTAPQAALIEYFTKASREGLPGLEDPIPEITTFLSQKNPAEAYEKGTLISVKMAARQKLRALFSRRMTPSLQLDLAHPSFENPLPLAAHLLKDKWTGEIQDGPVTLLIPGVFTDRDDVGLQRTIRTLQSFGTHVVVLPNPTAQGWLRAGYKELFGNPLREAQIINELLPLIRDELSANGVSTSKINVVGLSYGGFVATVLTNLDRESPVGRRILTGESIAISPPLNFLEGVGAVDAMVQSTAAPSSDFWTGLSLIWNRKNPSQKAIAAAKALTAHSMFRKHSIEGIKTQMQFTNHFRQLPPGWEESFSILGYYSHRRFSGSSREMNRLTGPEGSLAYWLNGEKPTKIILSWDDFLNPLATTENFLRAKPERVSVQVLPAGGHLGFMTQGWFTKLLEHSLKTEE